MGDGRTRACSRWKRCSIWSEWARKMEGGGHEVDRHDLSGRGRDVHCRVSIDTWLCESRGLGAEAEANVMDAIRECLAVRAEMGLPPTVATREIEVAI